MNFNKHCSNSDATITKISDNFSNSLELFLNNASRSPLPKSHKKIIDDYISNWSDGHHDPYYYNFELANKFKDQIGHFINCDSNKISIQTNVAQSFSLILHGLSWTVKDEIILIDNDYPSISLPFQTLSQPIKWVSPKNGIVTTDQIKPLLSKNTRLIALSWVNYITGQLNEIKNISKLCKENNIIFCVDATQALGVIPIDLTDVHVDFFTASLYKWCFCPQGLAVSIFSDSLIKQLQPNSSGVFSQKNKDFMSFKPNNPVENASKFEYGNFNILGIMLGHETFCWFNKIGIETIHKTLIHLSQSILLILKAYNFKFPVQYSDTHQSSIISFIHPNPTILMKALINHGGNATYRNGLIRLSPGIYQTDRTINALNQLILENRQ